MLKRTAPGFTLVELLVVIAVLAVMAAGVFVAINPVKRIGQANDTKVKSDVGQIVNALQAYYTFNQHYPSTLQQLVDSGDLKVIPNMPQSAFGSTGYSYYYVAFDDVDTGDPGVKALIYVPIYVPSTNKWGYWCWDSESNVASETTGATTAAARTVCWARVQ